MTNMSRRRTKSLRRRMFEIFEVAPYGDRWAQALEAFIVAVILANVLSIVLSTESSVEAAHGPMLARFEHGVLAIFALEYAVRLWVCVERLEARGRPAWRARLDYALTPYAVIDFLTVAPFALGLIFGVDAEFLTLLRLLRLFKLARYSTALASLGRVLSAEAHALFAAGFIMLVLLLLSASLMYFAERAAQPAVFSSIPAALWWAAVTLTTVGYGDIVPVTPAGKLIASLTAICGLAMFALPVGIIASGFSEELHRRGFMVRWEMVARVPLFEHCDVATVARICRLLKTRRVRRGETVCRAGDPGEALAFLIDGRLLARHRRRSWELGPGDYFGERALLARAAHDISVTAQTPARLLLLEARDLQSVMSDHPAVAEQLHAARRAQEAWLSEADELSAHHGPSRGETS